VCSWVYLSSWLYGHDYNLAVSAVLFTSSESLAPFLHRAVLNTNVVPVGATVGQFSSHSSEIHRRMWSVILLSDTMRVSQWVFSLV